MSLKRYKTDVRLENEGVRFCAGFTEDGREQIFRLGRFSTSNKRFAEAYRKNIEPHMRNGELAPLSKEAYERIEQKSFAEGIILGWENIEVDWENAAGRSGPLEYSPEMALWIIEELRDLYKNEFEPDDPKTLYGAARRFGLFQQAKLEGEAKN